MFCFPSNQPFIGLKPTRKDEQNACPDCFLVDLLPARQSLQEPMSSLSLGFSLEGGASGARNGQKGPNIGIHMTAVSTGFYRWVEDKGRK